MPVIEIIGAILFVVSSGLLFNERYRQNILLVGVAGLIAVVSTTMLTWELIRWLDGNRSSGDRSNDFGPAAIWTPPRDLDLYSKTGSCRDITCFLVVMRENGASPEAVAFSRTLYSATESMGYMSSFQEAGRVDVATVVDPGVMNEGFGYAFVNGEPKVLRLDLSNWQQSLNDLSAALRGYGAYQTLMSRRPQATLWRVVDVSGWSTRINGGQTILVTWDLRDGCRGCEVLGTATFVYSFNREGAYEGVRITSLNSTLAY